MPLLLLIYPMLRLAEFLFKSSQRGAGMTEGTINSALPWYKKKVGKNFTIMTTTTTKSNTHTKEKKERNKKRKNI